MNWKAIEKKNPKAFKIFVKWINDGRNDKLKFLETALKNERGLFDFFDEQSIFVIITINDFESWFYEIQDKENDIANNFYTGLKTRKEAETQAFKLAFNILEKL